VVEGLTGMGFIGGGNRGSAIARGGRTAWIAAALVLLGACQKAGDVSLSNRIASVVSMGDGAILQMGRLAPFRWDHLYVFRPYTPTSEIERELGFAWPEARAIRLEARDDASLLVFVAGRRVARYVAHRRDRGDFSQVARPGGYWRSEAVFRVKILKGSPYIERAGAG
jgi:hypothetical protein